LFIAGSSSCLWSCCNSIEFLRFPSMHVVWYNVSGYWTNYGEQLTKLLVRKFCVEVL